jgi:hypothetical protein
VINILAAAAAVMRCVRASAMTQRRCRALSRSPGDRSATSGTSSASGSISPLTPKGPYALPKGLPSIRAPLLKALLTLPLRGGVPQYYIRPM